MKLKFFIFALALYSLYGLTEKTFAKSPKSSEWKKFRLEYQSSGKSNMKVGWNGKRLVVKLKPKVGEGGYSLARRVLEPKYRSLKTIRKYNKSRRIYKNRFITFPFKVVNNVIRSSALKAVFFKDKANKDYWKHRVIYGWETTTLIAGLFTKKGIKARHLVKYNKMRKNGNILKKGDIIKIPWKWISPELALRKVSVKPPLKLKREASGKFFAHYQMKPGETIYSSVVIRFTGRLLNDEVNQLANKILKLNNISDAKFIKNRQKIKIPLEWLSEEFIGNQVSENISRKKIKEKSKKRIKVKSVATKKKVHKRKKRIVSKKTKTKTNVHKIHVILDSGHGGGDSGASGGSRKNKDLIYEDEVVYDVSKRMSKLLKKEGVIVHPTLADPNQRKPVRFLSHRHDKDEQLLVTPRYSAHNSRVGANMRVYLVNHLYKKLRKQKVPPENILFISLHGDSLHSSLRGVMVYYPDRRLRRGSFRLRNKIYRSIKEYDSKLTFHTKDNRYSEKLSKSFGKIIIDQFRKRKLSTHRGSSPVRGYLYRKGKKTLPAILRYNKVPTSVLVEIANLNNRLDRIALLKSKTRQKIAIAISNSVYAHFGRSSGLVAKR
ncbi:MAG: N-acetylmuramoyl-L-alanine amidase [SAR324 cluster bacterium]|nr:N-acetylmuramoyl-L-alanine amidase [SAR324 cluster bacterium]